MKIAACNLQLDFSQHDKSFRNVRVPPLTSSEGAVVTSSALALYESILSGGGRSAAGSEVENATPRLAETRAASSSLLERRAISDTPTASLNGAASGGGGPHQRPRPSSITPSSFTRSGALTSVAPPPHTTRPKRSQTLSDLIDLSPLLGERRTIGSSLLEIGSIDDLDPLKQPRPPPPPQPMLSVVEPSTAAAAAAASRTSPPLPPPPSSRSTRSPPIRSSSIALPLDEPEAQQKQRTTSLVEAQKSSPSSADVSLEKRVQLLPTAQCDFALQLADLDRYRESIAYDVASATEANANDASINVFYRAPTVDYSTTAAESVKIVCYPDKT